MATEAELGQEAVDLAQQTSYSWEQYLARIRSDPSYAYKNTSWFKAGGKLEETKHLSPPPNPDPPDPQPPSSLDAVQRRMFLANNPLDCLQAPTYMVPVCTADHTYRYWYTPDVIKALMDRFGMVETWCDCRVPSGFVPEQGTGFDEAVKMSSELGLDGAWGQCETQAEFDNGYAAGARRMVGKIDILNETSRNRVASAEVQLTLELYRNCMPWQLPDWMNCNAGIGGNCIACYADQTPCYYTPVQAYKDAGLYVSRQDSVYGVGMTPADWQAL